MPKKNPKKVGQFCGIWPRFWTPFFDPANWSVQYCTLQLVYAILDHFFGPLFSRKWTTFFWFKNSDICGLFSGFFHFPLSQPERPFQLTLHTLPSGSIILSPYLPDPSYWVLTFRMHHIECFPDKVSLLNINDIDATSLWFNMPLNRFMMSLNRFNTDQVQRNASSVHTKNPPTPFKL